MQIASFAPRLEGNYLPVNNVERLRTWFGNVLKL